MKCPSCKVENTEDRRFCAECGAPLPITCPDCGFPNQPSVNFCGGCGLGLAPPSTEVAKPEGRPVPPAGATREAAEADPFEEAQMNGRRFTITTLTEGAQRGKAAGSAAHQPCTENTGFRHPPAEPHIRLNVR